MAGLKGQVRIPNANQDPRVRRNSVNLASVVSFISADSVISIDGDGIFQVDLDSDGGLVNTAGELGILLQGNDLQLTSSGLSIGTGFRFEQQAAIRVGVHDSMSFTQSEINTLRTELTDLGDELRAVAFFQGQM